MRLVEDARNTGALQFSLGLATAIPIILRTIGMCGKNECRTASRGVSSESRMDNQSTTEDLDYVCISYNIALTGFMSSVVWQIQLLNQT